jgi:hypothetical protein
MSIWPVAFLPRVSLPANRGAWSASIDILRLQLDAFAQRVAHVCPALEGSAALGDASASCVAVAKAVGAA